MRKKILTLYGSVLFCTSMFAQQKGLIISEFLTNPNGSDSPFEYVELVATQNIDFSLNNYSVVFTDNGNATSNGWKEGGSVSYGFSFTSGSVVAGQVVYVGGSSMAPLSNGGVALKTKNTGSQSGDGFGSSNSGGVLGQGGSNADGIAVFNIKAGDIVSSTVPVDAIFFGSAVGSAYKTSSSGYRMPVNDKYNGGILSTSIFLAPDPGSDQLVKASGGVFNSSTNTFTTARTFVLTSSPTYNTTSIIVSSGGGNVAPAITLATPAVSGTAPATVDLSATATDSDGTISKVEFFNGSTLLGTDLSSPYTFSWTSVAAGTYTITAKATDNLNAVTTSAAAIVTVNNPVNVAPTLSFNATASNYVDLASGKVSCVMGNATDPAIVTGLDITVGDENLSTVTFSMTSSKTSVIPNANFTIVGTGSARQFKINPVGVGYATITLKVTDSQGLNKSISLSIAVSNALATSASKDIYHVGVGDGSTAIPIDNDYMFIADDESNVIKLFNRNNSGLAVYKFDANPYLNLSGTEVDIEASFRSPTNPNRIYWMGSESNSKSGEQRPDRNRVFATDIVGTGANATLTFVGYYSNLRSKLVTWGDANGYNFTAKTATGIEPKRIDGFNIEGAEIGPDGTTLYIGFRAPYVGTGTNKALICPLLNFESWFGNGSPSTNPTFGSPIELNLNNHGIRSLGKNASNNYLIVAGSYASTGTFELYQWDGLANTTPILLNADLTNLKPEGIVEVPASLSSSFQLDLISDLGSNIMYNDAIETKDLVDPNFKKFLTSTILVSGGQARIALIDNNTTDENGNNVSNEVSVSIKAFPNPTSSTISLEIPDNGKVPNKYSIYSVAGKLVKVIEVESLDKKTTLNLTDLENGIYLIRIEGVNGFVKIIKQ